MTVHTPISVTADDATKQAQYAAVEQSIFSIIDQNTDWTSAMATAVCELHHAFEYYHWTGFYRVTAPERLAVGPYQGGHGCVEITFDRGVCGAAARLRQTQLVPDVELFPGHIACSSTTRSEVVVPVISSTGKLLGVFDVDSNLESAFGTLDQFHLEIIMSRLADLFGGEYGVRRESVQ